MSSLLTKFKINVECESSMYGKRILITGITGFIGCHLVAFLKKYYPSSQIIGISRETFKIAPTYDCYSVNLLNQDEIEQIINQTKPDYIFHLAGLVFSYDWTALYNGNVMATVNLLEAIKNTGVNAGVIIAGSAAEYGIVPVKNLPIKESYLSIPHSPYGMTKLWQTNVGKYYALNNIPVVMARIFNIIGSGASTLLSTGDIFSQISNIMQHKHAPQMYVGNLQLQRDFLDIEDVCSALVALAIHGVSSEIYNICSGYSHSLEEILDLCLSEAQLNVKINYATNKMQNIYQQHIYGSNAKIMRDTNWSPVITLQESVRKILNLNRVGALTEDIY